MGQRSNVGGSCGLDVGVRDTDVLCPVPSKGVDFRFVARARTASKGQQDYRRKSQNGLLQQRSLEISTLEISRRFAERQAHSDHCARVLIPPSMSVFFLEDVT